MSLKLYPDVFIVAKFAIIVSKPAMIIANFEIKSVLPWGFSSLLSRYYNVPKVSFLTPLKHMANIH